MAPGFIGLALCNATLFPQTGSGLKFNIFFKEYPIFFMTGIVRLWRLFKTHPSNFVLVVSGWELAVVGVWEGGPGNGLLLCHLYRQLHGSELRQEAAAAEALGRENQVMVKQWCTHPNDCFCCCWESSTQSQPLRLTKKTSPSSILKRLLRKQETGVDCLCVSVRSVEDVCAIHSVPLQVL